MLDTISDVYAFPIQIAVTIRCKKNNKNFTSKIYGTNTENNMLFI